MPVDAEVDIQAQKILSGLKDLEKLLDKPYAGEAFDLTNNARTTEQFTILRRLRKSLGQYINRRNNLFYVGFVGHFSSGKSSTINSVLEAWGTSDERKTDLNPTDTTITLITCAKNSDSLLGVIKEGHVTIRHDAVESPFLEQVVLVDTPGSGDTQFVEEVARDFLPICDVIFFFVSATSPFDKTDLPLLEEINRRLKFMPLKFIVTRADEFREDFNQTVSDQNFDQKKKSNFLSEVITRLNQIMFPVVFASDSFYFIDNKAKGFGVSQINCFIRERSDPSNASLQIAMHSHKLQFYRSNAAELRAFFSTFITAKLSELNKVVAAAETNIKRYNDNVRLSSGNLSRGWIEYLGLVSSIRASLVRRFRQDEVVPIEIDSFWYVHTRKLDTRNILSQDAETVARQISSRFTESVLGNLRRQMTNISYWDGSLSGASEGAHIGEKSISGLISFDPSSLQPIVPASIVNKWVALRESRAVALREFGGKLRGLVNEFSYHLGEKYPVSDIVNIVGNARQAMELDLTHFFRNAELYRDGVFSHTTKESISTLGIGGRLDSLESEFTELDQQDFVEEANVKIFPRFEEAVTNINGSVGRFDSEAKTLYADLSLHELRVPSPPPADANFNQALEQENAQALSEISSRLQDDIDRLAGAIRMNVEEIVAKRRAQLASDLRTARRKRLFRYISFCVGGALLGLLGYSFYLVHWQPPADMFFSVVGNLLAEAIIISVGFFLARLLDDFPATTTRMTEDARALLSNEVYRAVEEGFRSYNFTFLSEEKLSSFLTNSYRQIVLHDSDGWSHSIMERLESLRKLEARFHLMRDAFEGDACAFIDAISLYLSNTKKNIEDLNKVAENVKHKAIEPSFNLLEATKSSLEELNVQIKAVEFS